MIGRFLDWLSSDPPDSNVARLKAWAVALAVTAPMAFALACP